jgi:hypothetical protein
MLSSPNQPTGPTSHMTCLEVHCRWDESAAPNFGSANRKRGQRRVGYTSAQDPLQVGHTSHDIPLRRNCGEHRIAAAFFPEPAFVKNTRTTGDKRRRPGGLAGSRSRLGRVLLLALGIAGCAANRGAQGPNTNPNLITQEEIEAAHQPDLFDVVRALRPMWLRQYSATVQNGQETGVSVYVDNQRIGGLEALRDMTSTTATALRYYSPSEAQSRFGLGNLQGVIEVTIVRAR